MENQAVRARGGAFFIVIGWIAAILSIFRYPFIFGVLGVIMGIMATKKGSRGGIALIMASILFMAIGLIYSGVIWNYTSHYLGF